MANFAQLILNSLNEHPERQLLRWYDEHGHIRTFNGKEIHDEIFSRLSLLKQKKQEAIILIPASPEHVFWVVALMLRGITVVYPPRGMQTYEIFNGPKRLYVLPAHGRWTMNLAIRLWRHRTVRWKSPRRKYKARIDPNPDEPALLTYSSGSSGKHKAIIRSHDVLTHQHEALKKAFPPEEDQVDFPLFPNVILHNLACGVCTVTPPLNWSEWEKFYPGNILDALVRFDVTTLTGNFYYFYKLLGTAHKEKHQFPHVKAVGVGGSPIPDWLLLDMRESFPNAGIYVIYGSTEVEPIAIRLFKEVRDPLFGYCVGTIHPDIHLEIKTVGHFLRGDKKFNWGHICVSGPHVVLPPGKEILDTGDIGFMHDGELYLAARQDNMEQIGEYLPFQLEHYLIEEIEMQDVAVIFRNGNIRVYYCNDHHVDNEIKSLLSALTGSTRVSCKKLNELPKDGRHLSKTLYRQLDENRVS